MDWLVSEYVNCANKYPAYAAKQRSQSSIKQYRNPFKFRIEFEVDGTRCEAHVSDQASELMRFAWSRIANNAHWSK